MRLTYPLLIAFLATPAVAAPAPIAGRWLTGESVVDVAPCGAEWCGTITRILTKPGPDNPQALDKMNPDPALRTRPILGSRILWGFRPKGDRWEGRIYDPRAGKTYRSVLARQPDNALSVKGCIGPFCRTMRWTPAR